MPAVAVPTAQQIQDLQAANKRLREVIFTSLDLLKENVFPYVDRYFANNKVLFDGFEQQPQEYDLDIYAHARQVATHTLASEFLRINQSKPNRTPEDVIELEVTKLIQDERLQDSYSLAFVTHRGKITKTLEYFREKINKNSDIANVPQEKKKYFVRENSLLEAAQMEKGLQDFWIAYPRLMKRLIIMANELENICHSAQRINIEEIQKLDAKVAREEQEAAQAAKDLATKRKEDLASLPVVFQASTQMKGQTEGQGENSSSAGEVSKRAREAALTHTKNFQKDSALVTAALDTLSYGETPEAVVLRALGPNIDKDYLSLLKDSILRGYESKRREVELAHRQQQSSSPLSTFENIAGLLADPSLQIESRELLRNLDSAALAAQIIAFGNKQNASTAINLVLQDLATSNPNFKRSLENPVFASSARDWIVEHMRFAKVSQAVLGKGFFGLNGELSKNPIQTYAQLRTIIDATGGSHAFLATIALTPKELVQKTEQYKPSSSPPSSSLPPVQAATPEPIVNEKPDSKSMKINKDFGMAFYVYEQQLIDATLGNGQPMSLEELKSMTLGSGKLSRDRKFNALIEGVYFDKLGEYKQGIEAAQKKYELYLGAQYSQQKLGELWGLDPEIASGLSEEIFVTFAPDNEETFYEDLAAEPGEESSTPTSNHPNLLGRLRSVGRSRKQVAQLAKAAKNAKFFANPAVLAGVAGGAATVGGIIAGFMQGVATGTGTVVSAIAGGAAGGFLIGGPVGALVGAGAATLGSLIPINGTNIATWIGNNIFGLSNAAPQIAQVAGGAVPGAVSNAATAAGSIAQTGANAAGAAATNTLSATNAFLQAIPRIPAAFGSAASAATVVGGPLAFTGATALIVSSMVIPGAFLTEGELRFDESKYFMVSKTASPAFAEDPTTVSYTITVRPKAGYENKITIQSITDGFTYISKNSTFPPKSAPLTQLEADLMGPLGGNEKTTTYAVDFTDKDTSGNFVFDDTLVTNTVQFTYVVTGEVTSPQTFITRAAVTFGKPPLTSCWPTYGTITQGPFGSYSHQIGVSGNPYYQDAIDIGNSDGNAIHSPFEGTITFRNTNAGGGDSPYGNHAILESGGNRFVFAHMQSMADPPGTTRAISKGDIIGYVGATGRVSGPHLHYELVNNSGESQPSMSLLNEIVPDPDVPPNESGRIISNDQMWCGYGK